MEADKLIIKVLSDVVKLHQGNASAERKKEVIKKLRAKTDIAKKKPLTELDLRELLMAALELGMLTAKESAGTPLPSRQTPQLES